MDQRTSFDRRPVVAQPEFPKTVFHRMTGIPTVVSSREEQDNLGVDYEDRADPPLVNGLYRTRLMGPVDDTQLTLHVESTEGAKKGSLVYIDRESMRVQVVKDNVLTVTRGMDGTKAVSHRDGRAFLMGPANLFTSLSNPPAQTMVTTLPTPAPVPEPLVPPVESTVVVDAERDTMVDPGPIVRDANDETRNRRRVPN